MLLKDWLLMTPHLIVSLGGGGTRQSTQKFGHLTTKSGSTWKSSKLFG